MVSQVVSFCLVTASFRPRRVGRWHHSESGKEVIVEEFVKGRELTCGVIRTAGKIVALPVTEIIPKKEYFDYEAKYKKGMADEVVPAQIPNTVSNECQDISRKLYCKLNCKGVVRFDYIYTGSDFYFLEVNTVPGLTKASIVPNMAKAYGWSFTELITLLINELKIKK